MTDSIANVLVPLLLIDKTISDYDPMTCDYRYDDYLLPCFYIWLGIFHLLLEQAGKILRRILNSFLKKGLSGTTFCYFLMQTPDALCL
jgi:hypothetical protein